MGACWAERACRAEQAQSLHTLGPRYQATFLPSEADGGADQAPYALALADCKAALSGRLLMSYSAQVDPGAVLVLLQPDLICTQCKPKLTECTLLCT